MKSSLEILRDCVCEYLRGLADLKQADIRIDGSKTDLGSKSYGVEIIVSAPVPLKVSKYAAGSTFSVVELRVEIRRSNMIASKIPSALFFAEMISKALHKWTPPLKSGYASINLKEDSPWQFPQTSDTESTRLAVVLTTQSLIQ